MSRILLLVLNLAFANLALGSGGVTFVNQTDLTIYYGFSPGKEDQIKVFQEFAKEASTIADLTPFGSFRAVCALISNMPDCDDRKSGDASSLQKADGILALVTGPFSSVLPSLWRASGTVVNRFGYSLGLQSEQLRAASLALHELLKGMDYGLEDIPRLYKSLRGSAENGLVTLQKVGTLPLKAKDVGIRTAAELSELLEIVKISFGCKFAELKFRDSIWQRLGGILFPKAYANENCGPLSVLVETIIDSAKKFGIKTNEGLKVLAKIEKAIETLPSRLKVQRIREGADASKIAIIGRSMGNAEEGLVGVGDAAAQLKNQGLTPTTFESSPEAWSEFKKTVGNYRNTIGNRTADLPDEIVKTTDLFKENINWASKLKNEGYTVIDLGNPNSLSKPSVFYEMEKSLLVL